MEGFLSSRDGRIFALKRAEDGADLFSTFSFLVQELED